MDDAESDGGSSFADSKSSSSCCDLKHSIALLSCLSFIAAVLACVASSYFGLEKTTATAEAPSLVLEPPIPGFMPGRQKPRLLLAQDINYPPFAFLSGAENEFGLKGIGNDFAHGLSEVCDIEVTTVQTEWADCWNGQQIGERLDGGNFHGCMTFTNLRGGRQRHLEFSDPILNLNKPAGILTRLVDGVPVVNGLSDLAGKKVAEVTGWAPTPDTLALSSNKCTGKVFQGYKMISPVVPEGANANDVSMAMLMQGEVDALWIYADQAHLYQCNGEYSSDWNCTLWEGFGSKYAYIQTGMTYYANSGTTLTMSKKGSGIPAIVNPCIKKFLKTESYYKMCVKYDLLGSCFPNSYFPSERPPTMKWELTAPQLNTTCASGYCPCPQPSV